MDLDVEIVHKSTGKTRFEAWLAILIGLAAIIAAMLATLEMHSNKHWEKASTEAADLSVELFGKIAATGPVRAAGSSTGQTAVAIDLEATERATHPQTRGFGFVRAYVDDRVATSLLKLAKDMRQTTDVTKELDPVAREVLATDTEDLAEIGEQQAEAVDEATKYGGRLSRALFALPLLAVAAILLGLAAVLGIEHGGPTILALAGVTLLVSALWGASALLI